MKPPPASTRLRIMVRGAVQGVGFRPFAHRIAREFGLMGWVINSRQGATVEVEGSEAGVRGFLTRLQARKPPHCVIESLEPLWLDPVGYTDFEIRPSEDTGEVSAWILPDIATCPACLADIRDPRNRRYRYPFTNCTHCGPRFTIIRALPYDRVNTSMRAFPQCEQCRAEYDNPADRRFHAQPNACPACGPHLTLWNRRGQTLAEGDEVLRAAADALREGAIVAVKGLGGFHLMVRADDEQAVQTMRQRKAREEKPFALMFPTLRQVEALCVVNALERRLLASPEAPIVLLHRRGTPERAGVRIAAGVAPGNPWLGIMLPANPLHHLLLGELGQPVVATSGNLSDEPICIEEHEALERLGRIAEVFLVHNRPIVRHADDSIVRVVAGRELVLRRARGFAPLPVPLPARTAQSGPGKPTGHSRGQSVVLGVGAQMKSTVALGAGQQIFLSQHIGDLENEQAFAVFRRAAQDLQELLRAQATLVAADVHPDYLSTRYARELPLPLHAVQHHHAHVLACMAENGLEPPLLGVAWDGTGYGLDATIWGGEFFHVTETTLERVAHFHPFCLPGGERAVREPRRSALGLMVETLGESAFEDTSFATLGAFSAAELKLLRQSLVRRIQSPVTTSAGRLFDAVASLLGIRQIAHYEGQAAMELEFAAGRTRTQTVYPFSLDSEATADSRLSTDAPTASTGNRGVVVNWKPIVHALRSERRAGTANALMAARFHNTMAATVLGVARRFALQRVVLSGGCFQNRRLVETTVRLLRRSGFQPYWHQRVPPNDGGVALGQVFAARRVPT